MMLDPKFHQYLLWKPTTMYPFIVLMSTKVATNLQNAQTPVSSSEDLIFVQDEYLRGGGVEDHPFTAKASIDCWDRK